MGDRESESMKIITRKNILMMAVAAVVVSFLLIPGSPGYAQNGPGEFISHDVAVVNGEVLSENELFFNLLRMFGEETVYDLIEDEIIVSEADHMGITVSPTDVSEYLANAYAPDKLSALLDAFGADLLEQTVGNQLLALNIVTARIDQIVTEHNIEVTDEQIRDFYLANLPLWSTPASVRFSIIETTSQGDASSALQRINAGESFETVCSDVSIHETTRLYGGDIGGLVPEGYSTGERAALESAAFDLDIGEVSDPIQADGLWYLVMPTEKTEYNTPELEEMSDYIRTMLLDELVQPYLEEWMSGLISQADIDISYPLFVNTTGTMSVGANGSFIAPSIGTVNGGNIPEGSMLFHLLRQYGSDVIKSVIEEILFVQVADEYGVDMTNESIRTELVDIYGEETLNLLEEAFTSEAVMNTFRRHLVALDVMGSKWQDIIEDQGIEVTDDEVRTYFINNLQLWTRPATVRFSMIVTMTETEAQAARDRILAGETFEEVCQDVSIDDGTRPYGGDIGAPIPQGTAGGANVIIEDTAFQLTIGGVSDPFPVGQTWFVIKVTDKTDAYDPQLGDMREEIYANLLEEKVSPFLMGWRSDLWENASIEVTYPIYAEIE